MAVRMGNSYVSEAAYSYAASRAKEGTGDSKGAGKSGVMKNLAEKFPNLNFSVGTMPFSGAGLNNVSISPKILKEMEKDPEKRMEYEAIIYDIAHMDIQGTQPGRRLKSHGFIIGDDGGLRGWGISEGEKGNQRQQSRVKRSGKKNWWKEFLDKQAKKKKVRGKEVKTSVALQPSFRGNAALPEAYLQNANELVSYLRDNFNVVSGGMARISGKFLRKCLTDSDSRTKLLDALRAADEAYARRKDEIGFQNMRVVIDENGEVTMESAKSTIGINEEKRRRQIAAAATKGDMQAVMAKLQQDLQAVEDGLRQNKCDEAEVEKAKRLIEEAKQRMGRLPDRAPTPEEQTVMSINMLI